MYPGNPRRGQSNCRLYIWTLDMYPTLSGHELTTCFDLKSAPIPTRCPTGDGRGLSDLYVMTRISWIEHSMEMTATRENPMIKIYLYHIFFLTIYIILFSFSRHYLSELTAAGSISLIWSVVSLVPMSFAYWRMLEKSILGKVSYDGRVLLLSWRQPCSCWQWLPTRPSRWRHGGCRRLPRTVGWSLAQRTRWTLSGYKYRDVVPTNRGRFHVLTRACGWLLQHDTHAVDIWGLRDHSTMIIVQLYQFQNTPVERWNVQIAMSMYVPAVINIQYRKYIKVPVPILFHDYKLSFQFRSQFWRN